MRRNLVKSNPLFHFFELKYRILGEYKENR